MLQSFLSLISTFLVKVVLLDALKLLWFLWGLDIFGAKLFPLIIFYIFDS
jgi:hypothetical protein